MISLPPFSPHTLAPKLLAWYDRHGRDLPWRTPKPDPYCVLVSEIMLQQTTVATVIPYFLRWMHTWPTLNALAKTNIEDVLHAWQGLGYYRRARNLHLAAHHIVHKHQGVFPHTEKDLLSLPGVGPYTAWAIMAIAFNQRVVTIDGNIARVFARILEKPGVKETLLRTLHTDITCFLPSTRIGDYTQALMDLGALICRPQAPRCEMCPLQGICQSAQHTTTHLFPEKKEKRIKPTLFGHFFFVLSEKAGEIGVLLEKEEQSLLKGLWRPLTSLWMDEDREPTFPYPASWQPVGDIKHVFTHFDLWLNLWCGVVTPTSAPTASWVRFEDLDQYPMSALAKKSFRCLEKHPSSFLVQRPCKKAHSA